MVVYFHRNPINYKIFYVGIGKKTQRAYVTKGRSLLWFDYVKQYGNPVIQIVHDEIENKSAKFWEIHYIKLLGKRINATGELVNISDGGGTGSNLNADQKSAAITRLLNWIKANPEKNPMKREEVRAKYRGDKNPAKTPQARAKLRAANLGKKHSEETKRKQSLLKMGNTNKRGSKLKPESIALMRITNKEIVNRPEVKAKLRLSMLGKKAPNRTPINMLDIKTTHLLKTFDCVTDALIYLNKPIKAGNISAVCKGKRSHTFGYKWAYASA